MTSPSTPSLPGALANVTNNAGPKPPMTDKEIRLECVKQAVLLGGAPQNVITMAGQMFSFVISS
jgi:hypothetical protein